MAQFVVRNLEDDVHARLRELARAHGQSMEEFVREALRSIALDNGPAKPPMGSSFAARFADIGLAGDEVLPELRGQTVQPPAFD
ncbi:MAG: hypothetical protein Aurels2KO_57870 [Aureliella sp.]